MPSIPVNNLDPFGLIQGPGRVVTAVIRTGTVTYDTEYGEFARWIYIGASGDLSYTKWDGTTETLPNLAAGVWHPICSIKVNSASTTIAANQLRWGS